MEYNEQLNMVAPVLFDGPQLPLSIIKKKKYTKEEDTSRWL